MTNHSPKLANLLAFIRSHDCADVRLLPSGELRVASAGTIKTPAGTWVECTFIDVIPATLSAARNLLGY